MMNNFNLSNRTMIKLHVPRILSKGDQFEIYYGKWMMNGYIGPYLMTEFISQDKAWKYLLPLPQSKIDVFKREIEILIKELGIRHGDLSLSNMIYHEGDVYLIDFGMSWMLHDEDRADRELVDELLEEDQKKVQSLLGNAYGYRRNYY
jgi:tRNA A-37 threonylcarbamoyl transferase component Bud32